MTDQYTITLFDDLMATNPANFQQLATSFDDLAAWLEAGDVHAPTKGKLRLISQSVYGDKPSPDKGSYRHADNVQGVWGVELDYDGKTIPFDTAVANLRAAKVKFFALTTPSSTPDEPKWRVLLPFDRMEPPAARRAAAERGNGIVGGFCANESFSLSSSFYLGRAGDAVEYRTARGDGDTINLREDLPRVGWLGSTNGKSISSEQLLGMLYDGEEIHNSLTALANRGWTEDQLREEIENSRILELRGEKRYREAFEDARRGVTSALAKKQAKLEKLLTAVGTPPPYTLSPSAPASPRMLRRAADITTAPRKLTWLIRDRIEQPSFAVMFGPPEQGKTFVAIDMGCSVALGRPWRGQKVTKVPVHYLTGEGHNGFGRRLLAWKIANGISDADWSAADMFVSQQAFNMNDQTALDQYYDETKQYGTPGLLIIDTLTRFTPGVDQSSQKEMGVFVRNVDLMVKAWNCTVLILHHTGHTDQTRAMGSIVLKGAVDVEMSVHLKGGIVRLGNTKNKEGERFPEQRFKFRSISLPWLEDPDAEQGAAVVAQKSAVLDTTEDGDTPDGDKPVKVNKMITLMREALAGGPLAETPFRQAVVRIYDGTADAARKAFARQLVRALEAGVIFYDDDTHTYRIAHTGQDNSKTDMSR